MPEMIMMMVGRIFFCNTVVNVRTYIRTQKASSRSSPLKLTFWFSAHMHILCKSLCIHCRKEDFSILPYVGRYTHSHASTIQGTNASNVLIGANANGIQLVFVICHDDVMLYTCNMNNFPRGSSRCFRVTQDLLFCSSTVEVP